MSAAGGQSALVERMRDRPRWLAISATILLAAALYTWGSAAPASAVSGGRVPSPREGFMAPDFTLELLDGGEITLSELRGQVVVVNLWASWCPPCRLEMPAIQRTYAVYQNRGLEVIALNTTYQDNEQEAAAFIEDLALTFPVALDRSGEVSRRYQLRALPTTYFVDPEGVIQKVVVGGPMREALIRTTVEGLLPEGG